MSLNTLRTVIQKLDRLDTVEDGYYFNLPLHVQNATGACEIARELAEGAERKLQKIGFIKQTGAASVSLELQNSSTGDLVPVNCDLLEQRLNRFATILEKLPLAKLMRSIKSGGDPRELAKTVDRKEIFAHLIIDHYISAYLTGVATTDESLPQVFHSLPITIYAQFANQLASEMGQDVAGSITVPNVEAAFAVFQEIGKKYDFAVSDFDPSSCTPSSPTDL